MCGTTVLDKDGISGGAVCGEMIAYLASQGKTVMQQLDTINDTLVDIFIVTSVIKHFMSTPLSL